MATNPLCLECVDCAKTLAEYSIFDGREFVGCCLNCAAARATGPAPAWQLGPGWAIGHASIAFEGAMKLKDDRSVYILPAPGAYRAMLRDGRTVVDLLLNHDPAQRMGSTADGVLTLGEDLAGLMTLIDLSAAAYGGQVLDGIRNGRVRGFSYRGRPDSPLGQVRRLTHPWRPQALLPDYMLMFEQQVLAEVSIMTFPRGCSTGGTWLFEGSDQSMRDLYQLLQLSVAERLAEAAIAREAREGA